VKVIFYPMFPDFRKSVPSVKVPRLPLFVLLVTEVHRWGRVWSSFDLVISPSQRLLPALHTANIRDEHPCPQRDSKPQYR